MKVTVNNTQIEIPNRYAYGYGIRLHDIPFEGYEDVTNTDNIKYVIYDKNKNNYCFVAKISNSSEDLVIAYQNGNEWWYIGDWERVSINKDIVNTKLDSKFSIIESQLPTNTIVDKDTNFKDKLLYECNYAGDILIVNDMKSKTQYVAWFQKGYLELKAGGVYKKKSTNSDYVVLPSCVKIVGIKDKSWEVKIE